MNRELNMINKSIITGRLTKDVNLRKTGTGNSVASFTLAVNRRFVKEGEQEADFISCVAWRQSAEFLAQYTGKGDLIGVEGRIQSRSYDDEKGRRVYVTEVVCDSVCILASKNKEQATNNAQTAQNQATNDFTGFGNFNGLQIDDSDLPF